MSNKFDPILGEYRQADTTDVSGLVPYTGATGNVDLGSNDLALTGTLDIGDVTTGALIIGDIGGDARGVGSIDIQQSRTASTQVASGQDSIAFGKNNTASSRNGIAIGRDNTVNTSVYGYYPDDQQGIAIGRSNSIVTSTYDAGVSVAIGKSCSVTNINAVAIGQSALASGEFGHAIGGSVTASGLNSAAIGRSAFATQSEAVAVGRTVTAAGANSISIGRETQALANTSIAIGLSIINNILNAIMIGGSSSFLTLNSTGVTTFGNTYPNERIHSSGNILATNTASLGAEKLTNGTFTGSATGWTVGSFAYSSNKITKTADGTSALTQTSAAMVTPLVVGETYFLTFTYTNFTVGTITVSCGGVTLATYDSGSVSHSGAARLIFKATSTANLSFAPSNTSRITTLDDVSLRKITGGDLIGLGSLYLGQDDTNRMQISVGATGAVTLNANGAGAEFIFSDSVRFNGSTKSSDGSAGFTGTGAYTNFTIKDGLITAAS